MEAQNTRTSEARPKRKEHAQKTKTLPEPRKHTKVRHYATFFEIFWIAPKGPLFISFDTLQHNGCQKSQRIPLLHFSAL